MKNIRVYFIVFLFGVFAIHAGDATGQERQTQERQGQERTDQERQAQERTDQERQGQERHDMERHDMEGHDMERSEGITGQDRTAGINQLPQAVTETLRDDYDDWRATEASQTSDPDEDAPFYMIKLDHKEEAESKVVMINNDGEVIDEEEVMVFDRSRMDRDRDRDYDQKRDTQRRDGQKGDDQKRDGEGREYTPVVFEQERQQERSASTDSLPQQVQSTLMQDFGDWSPTDAHLATDPEDGSFYYKVKMHNVAEGETKVVRITSQGEVMDEEKINPLDGIRDADRGRGDDDDDDDGWL